MSVHSDDAIIYAFRKATDELMRLRPSERRKELLAVLDKACQDGDIGFEFKIVEGK